MKTERPKRKPNRIPRYDYSTTGAYFVTVCAKNHRCIFWDTVGATNGRPPTPNLSLYGMIVDRAIGNIPEYYPAVSVDHYVVMPNHVHLLLQIHTDSHGRPLVAPTIQTVIQQWKGVVTKQIGQSVWQKSFHDHVIRNETDYKMIWQYIDTNPVRWKNDCLYRAEQTQTTG